MKRFTDKFDKTESCWEWKSSLGKDGYGQFRLGNTMVKAHRFSFEMYNQKKIEAGKFICHVCDNKKCVNPEHLFEGTPKDNTQDAINKGRIKIIRNTNVNLLDKMLAEMMRHDYKNGFKYKELVTKYNTSPQQVSRVINNLMWK